MKYKQTKFSPMKHYYKNTLLIWGILFISGSCSDNSDPFIPEVNGDITVNQIQAEKAQVKLNGSANTESFNFAVRKKGETNFTKVPSSSSSLFEAELSDLIPAQDYELTILADEIPNLNFEIIEFTTPPFNTIEDQNSKILNRKFNYYSERGFEHKLLPDTYNENANIAYYLIAINDESEIIELSHSFVDGLINFTIPDNLLSYESYEEVKDYYLAFSLNGGILHKIVFQEVFETFINFEGHISWIVFNPEPKITGVDYIKEELCSGETQYELSFSGYFFNKLFEGSTNYFFNTSTAVITRLDDQSEILMNEERLQCIVYERLTNKDQVTSPFGWNYLHLHKKLLIRYPDTNTGGAKFTSGDYKIKITFSSIDTGDFFETNEFEFTLP